MHLLIHLLYFRISACLYLFILRVNCHNIMFFKEAPEKAPGPVLLPVAAVTGRLDLHGHGLPRGVHPTLHPGQVQPLRVGQPPPLQRRGRGPRQRVLSLQLDVVHHRQPHAAGQRHLPQVRSLVGETFYFVCSW